VRRNRFGCNPARFTRLPAETGPASRGNLCSRWTARMACSSFQRGQPRMVRLPTPPRSRASSCHRPGGLARAPARPAHRYLTIRCNEANSTTLIACGGRSAPHDESPLASGAASRLPRSAARLAAARGCAPASVAEGYCEFGLEGLVSKRRDRPYRAGRSPDWVKNRNHPVSERVKDSFFMTNKDAFDLWWEWAEKPAGPIVNRRALVAISKLSGR
jgi:hypothetical protein